MTSMCVWGGNVPLNRIEACVAAMLYTRIWTGGWNRLLVAGGCAPKIKMLAGVVPVPVIMQFVNVMYRVLFVSIALVLITSVDLSVTPVNVMFHSPAPSDRLVEIVVLEAE